MQYPVSLCPPCPRSFAILRKKKEKDTRWGRRDHTIIKLSEVWGGSFQGPQERMETQDSCCCDVGQRAAVNLASFSPHAQPDLFCVSGTIRRADHLNVNVETEIRLPAKVAKYTLVHFDVDFHPDVMCSCEIRSCWFVTTICQIKSHNLL